MPHSPDRLLDASRTRCCHIHLTDFLGGQGPQPEGEGRSVGGRRGRAVSFFTSDVRRCLQLTARFSRESQAISAAPRVNHGLIWTACLCLGSSLPDGLWLQLRAGDLKRLRLRWCREYTRNLPLLGCVLTADCVWLREQALSRRAFGETVAVINSSFPTCGLLHYHILGLFL